MIIKDFDMPQNFTLAVLADSHIGNRACSVKGIQKAVANIKSQRNGYWCHLGDACESIHVGDKRFATDAHAGRFQSVNAQVDYFCELHDPIKDKCLFVLDGNHEEKIHAIANVGKMIGDQLGCVTGGRTIHATLTEHFNLFATHGAGSVNSRAEQEERRRFNDCDSIRKKLNRKAGDCIVMLQGHIHKMRLRKPDVRLDLVRKGKRLKQEYTADYRGPNGEIHEQFRWFGSTGSFLRSFMEGWTTYSEKFGFDPSEIGYLNIVVKRGRVVDIEEIYV